MEKSNYNINADKQSSDKNEDFLNNIDYEKLFLVFRKSIIWIFLILVLTNILAYLFIRYTKPLYESVSELKLDIKSEATTLGLPSYENENFNNLSGEIQLIKSRLFFSKLIKVLDLEISYYAYGKILNEERYKNSPFRVEYFFKNEAFYDKPFDVEIQDHLNYTLSYEYGGKEVEEILTFGKPFENEHIKITCHLNHQLDPSLKNTKYYFTVNSNKALINYIDRNITVEPLNLNANTIKVAFKDFNKYKARDIVDVVTRLYFEYSKDEKHKANKQKIDFLNQQLFLTEKKLEEFENYFEDFTINNKTINLQSDITGAIKIMVALDSQKFVVENKIAKASQIKKQLQEESFTYLTPGEEAYFSPELLKLIGELNSRISEKDLLLSSYNENTYAVTKKKQQIGILKNTTFNILDRHIDQLHDQKKKLEKRRIEIEQNFISLPSKGTEYNKAKRFHALHEGFYLSLMQKKNEFEIAEAGTVTNFIVLSPATLPYSPIYPNTTLVYGIGMATGLILGFLFIGIRYLMHNKINNQTELEYLTRIPILGVLPLYKGGKLQHASLVVNENPKSSLSESLRSVRTNFDFINSGKEKKIISVTSTISGEGKTFVAVNLAGLMSMSYMKVILVDLDMRKPKVHLAFGDEINGCGVSTVLIKKHTLSESIRKTPLENLDFLPAGKIPPNPSELILSNDFSDLLNELKQIYDVIVIDTPPVGLVTDGLLAMKKSDLQIYVTRADYTGKDAVKAINRIVKVNKFRNIALVLNGVNKTGINGYNYRHAYGSGYYEDEKKAGLIDKIKNFF